MSAKSSGESTPERLFELAPQLLCVIDANGVIRLANPASATLLGIDPHQLVGVPLTQLVVPDDADQAADFIGELGGSRGWGTAVLRVDVPGRGVRRIRWSVSADTPDSHRYAVAWDVTAKQHNQARYQAAMEASPTALLILDEEGLVVLANAAAEGLLGMDRWALLGSHLESFLPLDVRDVAPELPLEADRTTSAPPQGRGRDMKVRRSDGSELAVEVGLNSIELDGRFYVVVSLVDVSERERARREIEELAEELRNANLALEELAVTDSLTGLWNRRRFFEEADHFMRLLQQTGGPFSLIMLDLDDFKQINDRFGHLAGDEVLRRIADQLREVRRGSDFVARYGGEEFVIGLPGAGAHGAAQLAERMRESVESLRWEGRPVTASIGVATLLDLGERGTPTSFLVSYLIDAADEALYKSKAAGKNCVTQRSVKVAPRPA